MPARGDPRNLCHVRGGGCLPVSPPSRALAHLMSQAATAAWHPWLTPWLSPAHKPTGWTGARPGSPVSSGAPHAGPPAHFQGPLQSRWTVVRSQWSPCHAPPLRPTFISFPSWGEGGGPPNLRTSPSRGAAPGPPHLRIFACPPPPVLWLWFWGAAKATAVPVVSSPRPLHCTAPAMQPGAQACWLC